MVNGRTVRPKIGIRNPYSQPGCREKTSWFNRMGFGYFLGHVLCACGFSIPHLCLLGSDGFGVPLLHTGLAVLFAFLANSKWFCHGLSPFAYLWDDIIGTLLYLHTVLSRTNQQLPSLLSTGYNILMMLMLCYCTLNMRSEESCSEHKLWSYC